MNGLDEELVWEKGFSVVHHPQSKNTIHTETFLFAPNMLWPLHRELLEKAYPALYLGAGFDVYEEGPLLQV